VYNTQEPYIRQWMRQYYLFFNNSISTVSGSIFEVIAEWVLVVQYFCPSLWIQLQEFGVSVLPQALLQTTINQFTMDILDMEDIDAMEIDDDSSQTRKGVTVKASKTVPIVL